MNSRDYVNSLFGAEGRKAVVTGASSGLGAEMAKVLASAGADVLVVARRTDRLEQLAKDADLQGGNLIPCTADLSSESGVEKVGKSAEQKLGGCDILVANAGISPVAELEDMGLGDFSEVLELNLTYQWLLAKTLFRLLSESRAGRIINIASAYGLGASVVPGLGAYAASKHALVGLTRSQAVEWAKHGITANAIAPGYYPTEMTQGPLNDPEVSAHLRHFMPMDRFGQPTELATALLFLASPASSYVTGSVIPVDGGWTAW